MDYSGIIVGIIGSGKQGNNLGIIGEYVAIIILMYTRA